jgi:hypothetical protein
VKRVLSILLILALPASALPATELGREEQEQTLPLNSILRREQDVFASNAVGLYRAALADKQWKPLTLPAGMAPGGQLTGRAAEPDLIYYITCKWPARFSPTAGGMVHGIYFSMDSGQTWQLVSRRDDYISVYLHPNGHLFAATGEDLFVGPAHLMESGDRGKTWRDLNGEPAQGFSGGMFADPDHPGLVCITASTIRVYVLQATDETYHWSWTPGWIWWKSHQTEQRFLARQYSSSTTFYEFDATLANYFAHDFGSQASLPAFDIVPEKAAYRFGQGEPKVVEVSVAFLEIPIHTQFTPEGLKSTTRSTEPIRLPDQKAEARFWSVHVVAPDGTMTATRSSNGEGLASTRDRPGLLREIEESPDFQIQELTREKPYRRSLDLSHLYEFRAPGIYKVQLCYDDSFFGHDGKLWGGSFSGQVFTVTIE